MRKGEEDNVNSTGLGRLMKDTRDETDGMKGIDIHNDTSW
jgi:hypothetical protein